MCVSKTSGGRKMTTLWSLSLKKLPESKIKRDWKSERFQQCWNLLQINVNKATAVYQKSEITSKLFGADQILSESLHSSVSKSGSPTLALTV